MKSATLQTFTSKAYDPDKTIPSADGKRIRMDALPAFLRVLLMTDGLVTKSLESFFWEPICVVKMVQRKVILDDALPALLLAVGSEVIYRKVCLQGQHSCTEYAHATSFLDSTVLPKFISEALKQGKLGIGELLNDAGLETYRELTNLYAEELNGETHICRDYRIFTNKKAFISISEVFPLAVFKE